MMGEELGLEEENRDIQMVFQEKKNGWHVPTILI